MRVLKATAAKSISLTLGIIFSLSCATSAQAATLVENARAHYEAGNALVRVGKHQQAIEEYRAAYRLNPKSQIGRYSLQALATYGIGTDTTPAPDTSAIKRQSQELKAQALENTEQNIKSSERGANSKIQNIEASRNASVNDVLANPSLQTTVLPSPYYRYDWRTGRYYNPRSIVTNVDPAATQARVDQVNANADQQKQKIKAYYDEKAAEMRKSAAERAKIIDESASNLESQTRGSGVKIDASTSNLYVRQYK